jgi:hypothetical protein
VTSSPPKIHDPPGTMEFSHDVEETEELSNKLVAALKQEITALAEQKCWRVPKEPLPMEELDLGHDLTYSER